MESLKLKICRFWNLQEWYDIVQGHSSDPVFILIGEKVDLADARRTVKREEAEEFQKEHAIPYLFETSSKSGKDNKIIFETLIKEILIKIRKSKFLTSINNNCHATNLHLGKSKLQCLNHNLGRSFGIPFNNL